MYVELYGDKSRTKEYPSKVNLQLRHMSGSYFRDRNGKVKEYRQPLGSWRTLEFDRFTITDEDKCREEKMKGNSEYKFRFKIILLLTLCQISEFRST